MPVVPLSADPSWEQLRKFAKDIRAAVRTGNPRALAFIAEHHPDGAPDDRDLSLFPLHAAQLAVARRHGFASWPKLKHHVELVHALTRTPDEDTSDHDGVDAFLRFACLTYGRDDGPERWAHGRALLTADGVLATSTLHAAAATSNVDAVRAHLDRAPREVDALGGPFQWTPLVHLAYSRIDPSVPEGDVLACATALLDAGADPNAGYLWHGLPTPFTVLTGVLGEGELGPTRQPPHPHWQPLARLVLERGADPNDAQALYNRMFEPDDRHLELLLSFGLGRGDGGPWKARLGPALASPTELLTTQLRWAITHGLNERVALLADHTDLTALDDDGRTPSTLAALESRDDIVELLVAHGAPAPALDPIDAMVAALLSGDRGRVDRLRERDSQLVERARNTRPGLAVWATASGHGDVIPLLVELGFDINRRARMDVPREDEWETPLHVAVERDDIELARQLLALGADVTAVDARYTATPLGWAQHFGRTRMIELLAPLTP